MEFNGDWDLTPTACADTDGLTRVRIADNKLQYYEWGGDIVSAHSEGDGSVRIDLDWWSIDDTDAHEQPIIRRRAGKLSLSPHRSALQIAIEDEATSYVRCPGAPQ